MEKYRYFPKLFVAEMEKYRFFVRGTLSGGHAAGVFKITPPNDGEAPPQQHGIDRGQGR
jgi:hypothetical protein